MGLSAAFEIGKTGMRIYQIASEVVSENIANVNTPGYSRQRVVLESAPPTTSNGFPMGSGVQISAVERYYDALLQKQLVNASTTSGYDSKKSEVLQQIEPIFNEIAQDGLGSAISGFFNAWEDLTTNPTGNTERRAVLSNAQIMVDQFHYASRTLNDAIVTQNEAVPPLVADTNSILSNIAQLNGQIKLTELASGNANEMRDQRDYLVRQLSETLAVTYTENTDGTTDVSYTDTTGTYALVTGSNAATLSSTTSGTLPDGTTPRNMVQITPAGGGATTTVAPTTGSLGSVIQMRDTTIPDYLGQVNSLASTIVSSVNTLHNNATSPGGAYDRNGNPGVDMFLAAGVTAGTISLSFSDPTMIAASKSATAVGDNANAIALAQLVDANTMAGGTTTFGNYYNGLVAQIGIDVQSAKTVVTQDAAFMKQLTNLRESNSGVSLDEELADLMKYQRSYQASAKLITTAGDMMDVLLGMVR